jgi:hypothetical protein
VVDELRIDGMTLEQMRLALKLFAAESPEFARGFITQAIGTIGGHPTDPANDGDGAEPNPYSD